MGFDVQNDEKMLNCTPKHVKMDVGKQMAVSHSTNQAHLNPFDAGLHLR